MSKGINEPFCLGCSRFQNTVILFKRAKDSLFQQSEQKMFAKSHLGQLATKFDIISSCQLDFDCNIKGLNFGLLCDRS